MIVEKKFVPRLASSEFSYERYDKSLSVLRYSRMAALLKSYDVVKNYIIGWCEGDNVCVPSDQKALLFEDEDGNKTWFHGSNYYARFLDYGE